MELKILQSCETHTVVNMYSCISGCEFCVQIASSRQQAVMMVHYYPRAGGYKVLLDILAQQNQELSAECLAGGSGLNDLQHTADWQAVVLYVESLDASGVRGHCRLRPQY